MSRIRTIKPEFFQHEDLYDLELETGLPIRVAFAGLWTQADREGRFEWRPRRLKLAILPYDDIDFSRVLHACATRGLIVRYTSGTREFGCLPTWRKHQVINNRESPSILPAPPDPGDPGFDPPQNQLDTDACPTRAPRDSHADLSMHVHAQAEGEGEGERINTDSLELGEAPTSKPEYDEKGYKLYNVNGQELHGRCIAAYPIVGEPAVNGNEYATWVLDLRTTEQFARSYAEHGQQWVEDEMLKAESWVLSNPTKRKTRKGMPRFLNNWLARAVNGVAT